MKQGFICKFDLKLDLKLLVERRSDINGCRFELNFCCGENFRDGGFIGASTFGSVVKGSLQEPDRKRVDSPKLSLFRPTFNTG